MSDTPPARRKPPGPALYALAASYGLAGALVTGDWGRGMAVAGLVLMAASYLAYRIRSASSGLAM